MENQHQSLALLSTLELTQDQYMWEQKCIRICENYALDGNDKCPILNVSLATK